MSERTTGATDEQITAAIQRHPLWGKLHGYADFREEIQMRANDWAPLLVPEGYVIARAADCITAEQRAAIGQMERFIRNLNPRVDDTPELFLSQLDLLRAIANWGTDDQ